MFYDQYVCDLFERLTPDGHRALARKCSIEAIKFVRECFPFAVATGLLKRPEFDQDVYVQEYRELLASTKEWFEKHPSLQLPLERLAILAAEVSLASWLPNWRVASSTSICALIQCYRHVYGSDVRKFDERAMEKDKFTPWIQSLLNQKGARLEHYEGETFYSGIRSVYIQYEPKQSTSTPWVLRAYQKGDRTFATASEAAEYVWDVHDTELNIRWLPPGVGIQNDQLNAPVSATSEPPSVVTTTHAAVPLSGASIDQIREELARRECFSLVVTRDDIVQRMGRLPGPNVDARARIILQSPMFASGMDESVGRSVDDCLSNFMDIVTDRIAELTDIFTPYEDPVSGLMQFNPPYNQEQREAAMAERDALLAALELRRTPKP